MINCCDHILQAGVCSDANWHIWTVSNWIAMLYTSLSTEGYTAFGSYVEILDTITKLFLKVGCYVYYSNKISKRCNTLSLHYAAFAYLGALFLSHLCCIHIFGRVVKSYIYITYFIVGLGLDWTTYWRPSFRRDIIWQKHKLTRLGTLLPIICHVKYTH